MRNYKSRSRWHAAIRACVTPSTGCLQSVVLMTYCVPVTRDRDGRNKMQFLPLSTFPSLEETDTYSSNYKLRQNKISIKKSAVELWIKNLRLLGKINIHENGVTIEQSLEKGINE